MNCRPYWEPTTPDSRVQILRFCNLVASRSQGGIQFAKLTAIK